ncbi:MAG: EamA family transporter [Flavobacteriales bacterium]|nr:EamA family transporter [Flavobacteriales bacterium]
MERSIVFAIIAMLFAGVTAVLAKAGMRNVPSDTALLVRTSLIFLLVWANAIAFRHVGALGRLTRSDMLFLALSGITTFFSWLFYYRAMQEGNVSVVSIIDKGSVVVTLVLCVLVLKEPLTLRLATGCALVLAGLIVLIWK